MKELIDYSRYAHYCNVSNRGNVPKFKSELRRTQFTEIQNFLGKDLFHKLVNDADVTTYPITFTDQHLTFIFFGGTYTENNKTIFVRGIEEALANYLFANMIKTDVLATPTGAEDKINNYATKAVENQRAFEVNDKTNYAASCLNDLIPYLQKHFNDDGLRCGCDWSRKTTVSTSNGFFVIN